jgi:hypothetical protein
MTDYTLYLDESTTHSGNFKDNAFCMAGIIIKDEDYEKLQLELNKLKLKIWSDIAKPEDVILHQMQIITAIKSKQDSSIIVEDEYKRFKQNQNCKTLYENLGGIFDLKFITVIGASLDIKMMNRYYNCGNNLDPYLITLQMILENFCHFLCNNGGRGKILYESREPIPDQQLLDRYYQIKLIGSMYYTKEVMNKRLLSMKFASKLENNAGLQIADFVPNCFARKHKGFRSHRFNIDKQLRIYRYDGGMHLRDKFGVKNMP